MNSLTQKYWADVSTLAVEKIGKTRDIRGGLLLYLETKLSKCRDLARYMLWL